jgi:flagellar basal body-associated protein FliL
MAETLTATTNRAPAVTVSRATAPEGFIRAWLPAIIVLIGMPLLALAATKYVLLPPMKQAFVERPAWSSAPVRFFAKIPLNISGATGAHSGIKSVTLIGIDSALKDKVEQNKAALTELAASVLKGKTTADLDQPGALNAARAQLRANFNRVLGEPGVNQVYISEWPQR